MCMQLMLCAIQYHTQKKIQVQKSNILQDPPISIFTSSDKSQGSHNAPILHSGNDKNLPGRALEDNEMNCRDSLLSLTMDMRVELG